MPIYEYRCQDCNRRSSVYVRSMSEPATPACSYCKSSRMIRAVSSFAYHRSSKGNQKGPPPFDAPGTSLEYYSDPANIGRRIQNTFNDHGMEMPETVRETIESARKGETPKGLDL